MLYKQQEEKSFIGLYKNSIRPLKEETIKVAWTFLKINGTLEFSKTVGLFPMFPNIIFSSLETLWKITLNMMPKCKTEKHKGY